MSNERVVYTYRSWKNVLVTLAILLFVPGMFSLALHDAMHPPRSLVDQSLAWVLWLFVPVPVGLALERFWLLCSMIRERIVIEGGRLQYFDWMGRIRVDAKLEDFDYIWKNFGWKAYSQAGSFSFSSKLKGHQHLLADLLAAGARVSEFSKPASRSQQLPKRP